MRQTLSAAELANYLARQVESFFPDGPVDRGAAGHFCHRALERIAHCHAHIRSKYHQCGGEPVFDHLHTDHWAAFLYLFANSVNREDGDLRLADKVYALNKALHSLDVYHAVQLPPVFMFVHPVGTVIGRATIGNYFAIYQNCSIGGDVNDCLPVLGEGVVLYAGARVIGPCSIGDNCLVASGATVMTDVPAGSVAFGQHPQTSTKPTRHNVRNVVFGSAE